MYLCPRCVCRFGIIVFDVLKNLDRGLVLPSIKKGEGLAIKSLRTSPEWFIPLLCGASSENGNHNQDECKRPGKSHDNEQIVI